MLDDTTRANLTRFAKSLDNKTAAVLVMMLLAGRAALDYGFEDERQASDAALKALGIDPDILDKSDAQTLAADIVDAFDPSGPRQPLMPVPPRVDQKSPLRATAEESARFAVESYILAAGIYRDCPSPENATVLEAVVNRMWWAETALRIVRDLETP